MDLREPLIEATKKLKAVRDQLDELQARKQEPVAIIAAACRLPGGIDSLESYWQLLDEERDAIEPFPASRWNADELYDADADAPGKTYCTQGGFVRDVDRFDAGFFGIAPREAEGMDPAQRLALECAWEALERAGIPPAELPGILTGVYLGTVGSDYEPWGGRLGMVGMNGYGFTGRDGSVLSGRISYTLGLQGPSITVNTACSSSLVALHLACMALRAGECQLAFCGGSQVMITPGPFVEFSRLRGMARDGRCKAFSDDADGVGWAEGCTMLLLQPLSDAQRDGRRILAVVRGSAVNQDGRSQGLTAPNGPAQERVIARALAECGLTSADIDAVEAHGTGTPLGDPVEAGALAAAYGPGRPADRPLYIGSVKSNLGHAQAASGTAGVIKMALALAHEKLPRSLHAERPMRHISWNEAGLQLLDAERPWPRGPRVRRAGINAFGISGTNAHVILEEAPAPRAEPTGRSAAPVPLVVSAADDVALAAQAERLADHLEQRPATSTLDLAFTLANGRAALTSRLALAVPSDAPREAIAGALRAFASGRAPAGLHVGTASRRPGKLVMLFSGQGSQRPEMGVQLHGSDAVFRAELDAICAELDRMLPRPLREVMFAPPGSEAAQLLDQTEYTQPALFALEVALYRRWEAWGLVPDLVLGHSIGELAAAHVAGILTLADACTLVAARGCLMQRARGGGAMYAIGARDTEVAEQLFGLEDRLSIAAVNGPEQTVISGDAAAAEVVAGKLAAKGKRVHRLRVSHAFHSPHMDSILDDFREVARALTYHPPRLGLVGNLTGAVATADQACTAEYWVRQVRGAVRFCEAIRTAEAAGADRYLECGPRAVLAGMAAACATTADASFVASLPDGCGEAEALAAALASAYVAGATPRWNEVFAGLGAQRIDAPTYAFQRTRYWLSGAGRNERDVEGAGLDRVGHELLGAVLPLADGGHVFTARISRAHLPWLGDHRVFDHVVIPGMCVLELVLCAGQRVRAPRVRDLVFEAPLILGAGPMQLQLAVDAPDAQGQRGFRVHARPIGAEAWSRHASGTLEPEGAQQERAALVAPADAVPVELAGLYDRLAAKGLAYGPAFRGLRELSRRGHELYGRLVLPASVPAQGYAVHPALLDAGLHAILAAADQPGLRIPFELGGVRLAKAQAGLRELHIHIVMGEADAALAFHDPAGALVLDGRIGLRAVSREDLATAPAAAPKPRAGELYRLHWALVPPAGGPQRGAACAIVGAGPLSNEVAGALRGGGVHVVRFDTVSELPERLRRHDGISQVVRVLDPGSHEAGADSARAATAVLIAELQAWTADADLADYRYALITSQAIATAPNGMGALAHAPLWGLVRTVRSEHADRSWLLLDTDGTEASHEALAAALFAADEPEVALRKGDRLVPRLARAGAAAPRTLRPLPPDGTVLVTGGTRGLGAEVARHLARHHGVRHLLLVSRQGPAAPGASELVAALAALGCEATAAACDVADRGAVERLVAAIPSEHPLAAVFHCAAVLDDALAGSVSADQVARVFGPKVAGAWHLHQLTQRLPLSAFVLFSSIAGLIGNEGQSVYAAANTFLDALAAGRQAQGLPAQSLAWGAWAEVGMAARLSARHRDRMQRSGLLAMSPEAALELMDRAIGRREHLLAPLAVDGPPGGTPLGRLLSSVAAPAAAAAAAPPTPAAKPSLRGRLDAAPPAERASLLLELVRTEVAAVLKLPDTNRLREDRPLDELGVDSLMAVDIRRRLENRLTTQLPATLVFDHPTCGLLVQYLLTPWSGS